MKSVLIVDDSSADLLMAKMILGRVEGVGDIHELTDAEDLITRATQTQEPLADVVILDVSMPKMSGYDALEALIENCGNSFVGESVVMLTSSITKEDMAAADKYDIVKRYCVKPLTEGQIEDIFA